MSFKIRRVVTGHDKNGKARAIIDEISDNVISRRPGQQSTVICEASACLRWITFCFSKVGWQFDVGDESVIETDRIIPDCSSR